MRMKARIREGDGFQVGGRPRTGRRRAAILAVALVAGGLGAVVTAQPASAGHSIEWAPWVAQRYTDSRQVHASLTPDLYIPLGAWRDADGNHHMSRVYHTYDLSVFAGKEINGAGLTARETQATDCANRAVEVWTTAPATDPTWADPPDEQTLVGTIGGNTGICPGNLYVNMTAVVQQALAAGRTTLSIELRVPADREGDTNLGRWLNAQYGAHLIVDYNTPPEVPAQLYSGGLPCVTQAPYPYLGTLRPSLSALFRDPDAGDTLTGTFAIWPAEQPDQRTTISTTYHIGSGWVSGVTVPEGLLVDGGTYGWQARLDDGTDTTNWSVSCYFTTDVTAPDSPPAISSSNYPQDGYAGGGELAHFTFAPNGVTDVAGYQYSWNVYPGVPCIVSVGPGGVPQWTDPFTRPGMVRVGGPDGTTTVDLQPPDSGPQRLYVRSIDRACNVSPLTEYDVTVRDTSPTILAYSQPATGVPLTLTVHPDPAVRPVTSYRYQVNYRDTHTVAAAADGSATITFTPDDSSSVLVEIASVSANGWVSPLARYQPYWTGGPVVSSDIYPDYGAAWRGGGGGVGVTGHFTFASTVAGIAGYQYMIDWGETASVPAGPDGTATIEWTPDASDVHEIDVWAVDADGNTISPWGMYLFYVNDPAPAGGTNPV